MLGMGENRADISALPNGNDSDSLGGGDIGEGLAVQEENKDGADFLD